ncbi:SRPBCC family protein [Streptomyces sp. JW3]|uniref:SRPBCC family protein n=1 Tax=Streptomyces sp. JW3 TaxID=3456955 RepID=UPI003FA47EB4
MGETSRATEPLLRASADIGISATPREIYELISDLPRSGEWSPECQGGAWVAGEPATVGAVFRGENHRSPDVVSWAPVVRGAWTTHAEVVAAEPGRTFRWAMHDSAGHKQSSVWGFDIEAAAEGSVLVHHFRMDAATEGIRGITAEMDEVEKKRFFQEWGDKVAGDLAATLERVKAVVEKQ